MKIISSIKEIRGFIENNKNINKKVSLIPTMGNLHDGHISLIEEAKKRHNIIVVSIFVNPLQFNEFLKQSFEILQKPMNSFRFPLILLNMTQSCHVSIAILS